MLQYEPTHLHAPAWLGPLPFEHRPALSAHPPPPPRPPQTPRVPKAMATVSDPSRELALAYPNFAPRAADAAAVALLMAQGQQLIVDLTPVLARLIELVPGAGADSSLLDSVPQLLLHLFPMYPRVQWLTPDLPTILSAFATLARHSQRLDAFPTLKMQFWCDVLQSHMPDESTRDVSKYLFTRPDFPAFVVDFGGRKRLPPPYVDGAVEDALVAFMTTLPGVPLPATASAKPPRLLSLGFVFRSCDFRVESLECLERFLDRSFASATRQFDLRFLEVSGDYLMPPDLEVLERIVHKCVTQYGVEDLCLDAIIPATVGGPRRDWVLPETTPPPMLAIARTVFGMDALPAIASPQLQPSTDPPRLPCRRLQRLSMTDNYVCLQFFAMRFSALPYGSSLEEDTTTYLINHPFKGKFEDYCRWLAFGLFYPRPKRFADRLRLRNVGRIHHCPTSTATFAKTLRNPAAELIFGGKNEHGGENLSPTTDLLVCVVKAGATVGVFQTGNAEKPTWTDTLPSTCELEAIYERADGSVCVVLPGVGLGWVSAEAVECIEREPLSVERSEQDGHFAGDIQWGPHWRASGGGQLDADTFLASSESLVETLGRQFHSLSFVHTRGFLIHVLKHCTNLTRLNLSFAGLTQADSDALLAGLSGSLRDQLQVLALNWIRVSDLSFHQRLNAILTDATSPPALRELRICRLCVALSQFVELYDLLQVNDTLELVEPGIAQYNGLGLTTQTKMERSHGQLLRVDMPLRSKLAFFSVVGGTRMPRGRSNPASELDRWLVRSIFAFAADVEVRRTLAWRTWMHPARDGERSAAPLCVVWPGREVR